MHACRHAEGWRYKQWQWTKQIKAAPACWRGPAARPRGAHRCRPRALLCPPASTQGAATQPSDQDTGISCKSHVKNDRCLCLTSRFHHSCSASARIGCRSCIERLPGQALLLPCNGPESGICAGSVARQGSSRTRKAPQAVMMPQPLPTSRKRCPGCRSSSSCAWHAPIRAASCKPHAVYGRGRPASAAGHACQQHGGCQHKLPRET